MAIVRLLFYFEVIYVVQPFKSSNHPSDVLWYCCNKVHFQASKNICSQIKLEITMFNFQETPLQKASSAKEVSSTRVEPFVETTAWKKLSWLVHKFSFCIQNTLMPLIFMQFKICDITPNCPDFFTS